MHVLKCPCSPITYHHTMKSVKYGKFKASCLGVKQAFISQAVWQIKPASWESRKRVMAKPAVYPPLLNIMKKSHEGFGLVCLLSFILPCGPEALELVFDIVKLLHATFAPPGRMKKMRHKNAHWRHKLYTSCFSDRWVTVMQEKWIHKICWASD